MNMLSFLYVNSLFCLQAVQKLERKRKSQGRKEKDETTKERKRTTKEAEEKVMILCTQEFILEKKTSSYTIVNYLCDREKSETSKKPHVI